ncbi:MAG: CBS domain-containing protein, partial [Gemmatimonadaceae bacterium]
LYPWPEALHTVGLRIERDSAPRIGVSTVPDSANAIRVMEVAPGSTAAAAGVRTGDVMLRDIPTVTRDTSIEEYIHQVLRTGRRAHIVVGGDHPTGLITLQSARHVLREEWATTSVQAVMVPIEKVQAAAPDEPVLQVLQRMQTSDINQMPVISDGHSQGMIGRDTILQVLQTRLHAEQHA